MTSCFVSLTRTIKCIFLLPLFAFPQARTSGKPSELAAPPTRPSDHYRHALQKMMKLDEPFPSPEQQGKADDPPHPAPAEYQPYQPKDYHGGPGAERDAEYPLYQRKDCREGAGMDRSAEYPLYQRKDLLGGAGAARHPLQGSTMSHGLPSMNPVGLMAPDFHLYQCSEERFHAEQHVSAFAGDDRRGQGAGGRNLSRLGAADVAWEWMKSGVEAAAASAAPTPPVLQQQQAGVAWAAAVAAGQDIDALTREAREALDSRINLWARDIPRVRCFSY